jgi:hypothetical protein
MKRWRLLHAGVFRYRPIVNKGPINVFKLAIAETPQPPVQAGPKSCIEDSIGNRNGKGHAGARYQQGKSGEMAPWATLIWQGLLSH